MPWNSGTGRWTVRFLPRSQHHGPDLHSEANLWKSWKYGKDLFAYFVDLERAYDRVLRDKLWRVLQEYDIDGQLLLVIKSFYCQPEVCVRVNGKKWKPFYVVSSKGAFVFSPLQNLHELDRQVQPNQRVCHDWKPQVQSSVVRRWFVLISSTESGLQRASLQLHVTFLGWKSALPKLRYFIFRQTRISVHCKWVERNGSSSILVLR